MIKTVAVIGATGMLGAPVAKAFSDSGYQVKIISRSLEKIAQQFVGEHYQHIQADIFDHQQLSLALKGADAIHINLSGNSPETYLRNHVEGTKQILKALDPSSIQLISMISTATAYPENSFRVDTKAKLEAEALIKASRIPHITFLPSWFYETLDLLVEDNTVTTMGDSTQKLHWLSASDFAQSVVQSYNLPELYNRRLTLFGPEGLTINDAADIYAATKGLNRYHMSDAESRAYAEQVNDDTLYDAIDLLGYTEKVGEQPETVSLDHPLTQTTTLKQWLTGH